VGLYGRNPFTPRKGMVSWGGSSAWRHTKVVSPAWTISLICCSPRVLVLHLDGSTNGYLPTIRCPGTSQLA